MLRLLGFLLMLVIVVFGLSFAVINAEPVVLNYYVGTIEMPLALVLTLVLGLGALLGIMVSMGIVVRVKREAAALRRKVRIAEKEVTNLRAIPLKDSH